MKINLGRMLGIAGQRIAALFFNEETVQLVDRRTLLRQKVAGELKSWSESESVAEASAGTRSIWPKATVTAVLLAMFSAHGPAQAAGTISGRVTVLHTYEGHTGILIRLTSMTNPDACPIANFLIIPNAHAFADFNKAALLTAQATGANVALTVDGCFENYPRVAHLDLIAQP